MASRLLQDHRTTDRTESKTNDEVQALFREARQRRRRRILTRTGILLVVCGFLTAAATWFGD
jgi:hypothetical protein